ncbi:hypothetical protein N9164_09905 [Draconibacterium sp.]|nr:hypothetical protein [Draconibacterium sp.]
MSKKFNRVAGKVTQATRAGEGTEISTRLVTGRWLNPVIQENRKISCEVAKKN